MTSMRLFRTTGGIVLDGDGKRVAVHDDWDVLVNRANLYEYLHERLMIRESVNLEGAHLLAPVVSQEVWAAGVTYYRSRTARMEESENAGGGSFYDRVYDAERPELFFKAAGWRVRGPDAGIRIRRDSAWNVPEPELALYVNSAAEIVGYTIGNDVSSRDIEGENPLYLPQAKSYDGSCALGPALLVPSEPLRAETEIALAITRDNSVVFAGSTSLAQMRRRHTELVEFLFRETSFPDGCVLLTGTGIIPGDDFTLRAGDDVAITIAPIGVLRNRVE